MFSKKAPAQWYCVRKVFVPFERNVYRLEHENIFNDIATSHMKNSSMLKKRKSEDSEFGMNSDYAVIHLNNMLQNNPR